MNSRKAIVIWLSILLLMAGCASTKITQRDEIVTGQIPRPDTIWVHDFVATPADVPNESVFAGQEMEHLTPQTPNRSRPVGKLGEEIAAQLVTRSGPWACTPSGPRRPRSHRSTTLSSGAISYRYCRRQCRQTHRHRFRLRCLRSESGGRRVPGDGPWVAKTGVRYDGCHRRQNARGGFGGPQLDCHPQPGGTHRQQRP